MKVLLDAHAFLWYFAADPRLSTTAAATMADLRNELHISIATLWEIGIKSSMGKLSLPAPFATLIPQQLKLASIRVMEIRVEHIGVLCALPFHHKDPFDRMVAAQCQTENLPVLSLDVVFDKYGIQRIW
jgi:PIN domain nuclease of toxin-antitoxin system